MSNSPDAAPDNLSREELLAALFANLVVQQTNMAFICMGRMPNPETGEITRDLEAARFFIDQLEMIEVKTKGNLDADEDRFLKATLNELKLNFVETSKMSPPPPQIVTPAAAEPKIEAPKEKDAPKGDDDKTRFRKSYG